MKFIKNLLKSLNQFIWQRAGPLLKTEPKYQASRSFNVKQLLIWQLHILIVCF